jgi:hypothetical protein
LSKKAVASRDCPIKNKTKIENKNLQIVVIHAFRSEKMEMTFYLMKYKKDTD